MASSKDKTKLLNHIQKYLNTNHIQKYLNQLLQFTSKQHYINENGDINSTSDETSDSEYEDDENNIKSIINTLIFTGFITTISKRTKYIKSGMFPI